jgi:hypothetical protein
MWVIASSPSWNLGNGICNMFVATIAIVKGTCMTIIVNWENNLVYYTTNVSFSYCNGCCSTTSNNGFLIVLILSGATLLSSCEIDYSSTLILNKFVYRFLIGARNLCIGCKDWAFILIGFYSSMRIFGQYWASPSFHVGVSISSCS